MDGANIWNDAHMNCISMGHGSNFASIHSKNEIDKISGELQVILNSIILKYVHCVINDVIKEFLYYVFVNCDFLEIWKSCMDRSVCYSSK